MIEDLVRSIPQTYKNKDLVIFDIGSRDCIQSIEFSKYFPKASIYAFECNPNTIDICRNNIIGYDNIKLIEGAVTDYDGTIKFYPIDQEKTVTSWKDGNPGASSLFKSNGSYPYEKYVQDEITTNCHRLDTVMKKENINKVDIIWMDLQGAELLALKSLDDNLKNVDYIYTEVSFKEIYHGQVMFTELNNYLSDNFIKFKSLNINEWQGDILYKNKFI
jgi:FkbM family methyltransferase